jgi:hypothetical protein
MSERISRDGTQERTPRNLQTRESSARSMEYAPPSTLPDPTPQPGWSFRWVAISLLNQAIPQNVSRKTREGWEPVKAIDHPELMLAGDKNGNVELGGLMLCKMPTERAQSRNNFYQRQNNAQMESVDNHFMRNNDPRMPLFSEKKTSTTRGVGFGSGTK